MNTFTKLAAALSIMGLAAPSSAAPQQTPDMPVEREGRADKSDKTTVTLDKHDAEFFDEATQGGLLEVRLGQLAVKQGASEEVRKYGQRMIDDHGKLNQQLAQVAGTKGLAVPQVLDKKHQDIVDKLAKETGASFDRAYMSRMVDDHKEDVKAFEKMTKDGKDHDMKLLANSALPSLREHLAQAKEMYDRMKK